MPDLTMIRTIEGSTAELCERAALHTVSRLSERGWSKSDIADTLAALGLVDRKRPAQPPQTVVEPPTPDPPSLCPGKRHTVTEGLLRQRSDGRWYCPECYREQQARRNARRRAARAEANGTPIPPPKSELPELPPGHIWCGCVGEKHVLTPESSPTTYVTPRGSRNCRIARRRADNQRTADGRRTYA